jgi:hypothetical protein
MDRAISGQAKMRNYGRSTLHVDLPRNRAMREVWLPTIALLTLVATGVGTPALARGGGGFTMSRFAPASSAHPHPSIRRNLLAPRTFARDGAGLRFQHRNQSDNALPIGIWPYWPSIDATSEPLPSQRSEPAPSVIVISGSPGGAPQRVAPDTPADYSYAAGCHAIPNGYHCDAPP